MSGLAGVLVWSELTQDMDADHMNPATKTSSQQRGIAFILNIILNQRKSLTERRRRAAGRALSGRGPCHGPFYGPCNRPGRGTCPNGGHVQPGPDCSSSTPQSIVLRRNEATSI